MGILTCPQLSMPGERIPMTCVLTYMFIRIQKREDKEKSNKTKFLLKVVEGDKECTIFKAITHATCCKSPTPPLTRLLCLHANMAKDPT